MSDDLSLSRSSSSVVVEPTTVELTDPKQYFLEIQEMREIRRQRHQGSILTVGSVKESCSSVVSDSLRQESRSRRARRLQNHDMELDDFKVRFSEVKIREHSCVLGDNPGGTRGPPIAIDWHHFAEVTLPVDEYESTRPPRRDNMQMQMPASHRMDLLRRNGYTTNQIIQLTRPVNIVRAQRLRTAQVRNLDGVNELVEKIARKTKNALTLGARKREERKFLEPYLVMARLSKAERSVSPARTSASSVEFTEPDLSSRSC